jgi:hypothetical protein
VAENLRDSDDRDFRIVGHDVNAGVAHLRTAHTEQSDVHALLQCGREPGSIHIPGCFACGDQERYRWHAQSVRRSIRCRLRSGERTARLVGELASGVPRVSRQAELLLLILELIEAVVDTSLGEEFLMSTLLA